MLPRKNKQQLSLIFLSKQLLLLAPQYTMVRFYKNDKDRSRLYTGESFTVQSSSQKENTAMHMQTAVTAYWESKQLLMCSFHL